MWRGQDARLYMHYEDGFQLVPASVAVSASSMEKGSNQTRSLIWQFPFGRLRHSADDGIRLLWLDFGSEDGEMVTSPCPICLFDSFHDEF